MSTTSMSLESLQFLLKHMDANRRFEIYNRCPSLREFEKSVPLKIDSLVLKENSVIVNDTTYKLGIIRKYIVGEAPEYVVVSNASGGVSYEVDKYGIRDMLDAFTATPGDVDLMPHREPRIPNEDVHIGFIENRVQRYEEELAQQRERRPNRNQETTDYVKLIIEASRAKLADYQSRRNNIPSNYEHFLQLTTSRVVDEQEQRTIEKYKHNKKFSEAVKQLTTVLFGGRSSSIHVTKFDIRSLRGVIRLPVGLKLKIEQLAFSGAVGTTLEALAPIMQESSYPLKKLDISVWSADYLTNPVVRAAGVLWIRIIRRITRRTISTITNSVVHFNMAPLSEHTLEELVASWIELQRPIGTEFTFHLYEPQFANEMEDILKRLNGVPVDEENVIIPMSDASQLKVSYGPFPEFAPSSQWAIKFTTVAVEH